ncbi:hypothetical protein GOP47_0001029 [Adiantum capillus-veneris]|uniref:Pentatricopeptide repeat-containing protein n=1 Tax=Adiantum capillus-veneris TaxID=13818 RepID=A0A9D4VF19_ADICA|nr:hypothetical protein GOP47_0001029 [Adiantum capillus-veneris]
MDGGGNGMAGGDVLERGRDLLWKQFFRDSSEWRDSRSSKRSLRQADLKHKLTKEPLWMDSSHYPSWASEELITRGFTSQHQCIGGAADAFSPSLIWACCKTKDLPRGIRLHDIIQKRNLFEKNYSDALVTMYAKCGELQKAQALLDMHNSSSVVPWTALIAGYGRQGKGQNALELFERMQREGILPNVVTYICILKACAVIGAVDKGKQIHYEILKQHLLDKNIVLGTALVDMYAKCGALTQAQNVLEKLTSRDVVSWNALMAGYVQQGQGQQVIECFERMKHEGILPDAVTYAYILKVYAAIRALDKGKQIHDESSRQGLLDHKSVLGNALVDMYAKCGALPQARSVLERLPYRDVVSWNALIAGYAQKGQGQQALEGFEQMQREGILPDSVTYVAILKVCASIRVIDKGKQMHDEILRQGLLGDNIILGTALVDMYAKCGALSQAHSVLENLPSRNVVSWNALITGYAQEGQGQLALKCFEQMQREGILPNRVTYLCILKACAAIEAFDKGKQIHDEISSRGLLEQDILSCSDLVDMHCKYDTLRKEQSFLENRPSHDDACLSAFIAENGHGQQASEFFKQMEHEDILPKATGHVYFPKERAGIKVINEGKKIHDEILRQGLMEHEIVLGTAVVDMYVKCGALHHAQCVLEKLSFRDAISWNALIAGYVQNGQGLEALECFKQMLQEGILPDEVTYACILKACAAIRAIDEGKQIHVKILRSGLLTHSNGLGSALVDMYIKFGALPQAQSVLEKLPFGGVVYWNALVAAYAQKGQGQQALECFQQMQHNAIRPNSVTFRCLLRLCSHLGLVEKGQELLDNMEAIYGLKPDLECFTCMVDLLGRAGHLVKAVKVIQGMPISADSTIWHCLLGACQKWVDVKVGTWAFKQAVELDKCDGAAYILMLNIYAAAGMQEKAKDIEAMRIENKAWKFPECSSWTDQKACGDRDAATSLFGLPE